MDRILLFGLVILPFLTGCIPIPVGSKQPPGLVSQQTLDSLIGEDRTTILTSLGRPNDVLVSGKSSYFIYGGHGDEYQVLLLIWVPVAAQNYETDKLFCVLLEFDEENVFRRYSIERHSKFWSSEENVSDCASTFFSPEELESFKLSNAEVDYLIKLQLLEMARQGGSHAQWELYQKYPTDESIVWLCRSADQGNISARNEIGQLYLYGSDQYRKFKNIYIEPDLPRSCMWFHLAGKAKITEPRKALELPNDSAHYESVEVKRTAKAMTKNEIAKAKKLILDWEPGQCERDLGSTLRADHYTNMISLCKAADFGDFSARDELGRTYFVGLNGIYPNLPRAYMWYHLAAIVYTPSSPFVGYQQSRCDDMTPEQRSIAIKHLNEWRPGHCEQNITKSKHNNLIP